MQKVGNEQNFVFISDARTDILMYVVSDNKNNNDPNVASIGSNSYDISADDSDLFNRDVMIGIIVWLVLLSLIILTVLLCLCARRLRESGDSGDRRPLNAMAYHKDGTYY